MTSPVLRWTRYAAWVARAGRTWTRRLHQRARLDTGHRVLAAAIVLVALVAAPAATAMAATAMTTTVMAGTTPDGVGGSQLSSLLEAFEVADSHGLAVTDYELSMDDGGWTGKATGQGISHWMVTTSWDLYRVYVAVAVWLLEVATSFSWMEMLRPPLEVVAAALQDVIDRLGVIPLFLTLAAVVAGGWLLKGRYGTAVSEVTLSLVLATLAGGILANPIAVMTGPAGGLTLAQELGTELSAAVVAGPGAGEPVWEVPDQPPGQRSDAMRDAAADEARSVVAGRIVELFVRTPHQLINYGTNLDQDDPGCAQVYDEALAGGPYEDDAVIRDRVGDCNEAYKAAASDPGSALVTGMFVGPSAALLVLLMLALTFCLLMASLLALWEAARLVVELVRGILPGDMRAGIWECACSAITALGLIVGILLGIGVYLQVMSAVFTSDQGWSAWAMFVFVDVLMLVAAVLMVAATMKMRRRGRRLGQKLASRTSPRPVSMPDRSSVPQVLSSAAHLASSGAHMVRRGVAARPTGQVPPGGAGAVAAGAGTSLGGSSGPPARKGPVRAAAGLTVTAGKVALASTVGLPVYGPRAATAAWQVAQSGKAALKTRLATAQAHAGAAAATRVSSARAFGQEYAHNVAAAARFAGKVSGATHLAGAAADASIAPGVSAVLAAGPVAVPDRPAGPPPAAHASAPRPRGSAAVAPLTGPAPRPVSPADLPAAAGPTRSSVAAVSARRDQLRRRLAEGRDGS